MRRDRITILIILSLHPRMGSRSNVQVSVIGDDHENYLMGYSGLQQPAVACAPDQYT